MLKRTKLISISSFVIFLLFVSVSFSLTQNSLAEKVANDVVKNLEKLTGRPFYPLWL